MTMKWLPQARQEVQDAVDWCNDQNAALGDALAAELARVVSLIERFPEAWHPLTNRVRRQRLNRFPYGVVYARSAGELVILAFAHQHRRPFYWRSRLERGQ